MREPCVQRAPAPARERKRPRESKVSQLEKKIEDLSSILVAETTRPESAPEWIRKKSKQLMSYSHVFPSHKLHQPNFAPEESPREDANEEWPEISHSSGLAQTSSTAGWPTGQEAQMWLERYREKMMRLCPFAIIPPGMTSDELRRERPFLWKSSMLEACNEDGYRQMSLGRELLKTFSEALITKPTKSLDLLQGLLLYIAWFHYGLNSFQVTNLLGLARSLCMSLGFAQCSLQSDPFSYSSSSLEKMRAYAGTYYLVTSAFATSKISEAFMSTNYLSTICDILEERIEYPTDRLLGNMVRVQELAQSIVVTTSSLYRNPPKSELSTLPSILLVRSFQGRINDLKSTIPPDLQDNPQLLAHIHIAEVLLYDISLQDMPPACSILQDTDRLELLWSLLGSLKSFTALRSFSDLTGSTQWPGISCVDCMYAFITCLKIITLDAPGWDLAFIRKDLDLTTHLERRLQAVERACTQRGQRQRLSVADGKSQEKDPYERLANMLRHVKGMLEVLPEPTVVASSAAQVVTPQSIDSFPTGMDNLSNLKLGMWHQRWEDTGEDTRDWDDGVNGALDFTPDLIMSGYVP
ncbi:uncharacterized protein JN550_000660 [Neoarthrinium moseri]|uniref:uncharacterized protein n=1 Tax=Neoarthrinium moseri TaxID=1658444 RepID=UPI001FDDF5D1|nr:uncharacterized protein JN550_000660 [Neoarthrinium moseri]KAI1878478.1 hypothetical protein JN550_000660 [Neoarthrinium moseri]